MRVNIYLYAIQATDDDGELGVIIRILVLYLAKVGSDSATRNAPLKIIGESSETNVLVDEFCGDHGLALADIGMAK